MLADEIRHERNILLQCVRYVINNNFFENKTTGPTCSKNVLNVQNIEEKSQAAKIVESVIETDESGEITMSEETSDCSLKTEDQKTESEAAPDSDQSETDESSDNSETGSAEEEISKKF